MFIECVSSLYSLHVTSPVPLVQRKRACLQHVDTSVILCRCSLGVKAKISSVIPYEAAKTVVLVCVVYKVAHTSGMLQW